MRAGQLFQGGFPRATVGGLLSTLVVLLLAASSPAAQADGPGSQVPPPAPQQDGSTSTPLVLVRGTSEIVDHEVALERVSIADPNVADAVVVSANEVVVNAKIPGQTTLLLWDVAGSRTVYRVHVTVDATAIQEQIDRLLPEAGIDATASGNTVILTGSVRDPGVEERILALATTLAGDAQVLNQITVPDRGQIMLKVRFAEVNRNALDEYGFEALVESQGNVATGIGSGQFFSPVDGDQEGLIETSQDAVNFFLFHRPSSVQAFIRALETRGLMKSLAEPNLMAVPGETASFLAGGEFPFPVLQSGGAAAGGTGVTIEFKEFGIRLNFVPFITNSGAIHLRVMPEVSQLDFTQGLEISGFSIPALLTRRAETVIELSSGQTFAIAGLVDNTLTETINKLPFLGDIPILGALFRSEQMRQNRSELLVLVTPHIVRPVDGPPPPVPTGEPETWEWVKEIQYPESQGEQLPDESGEPNNEGGPR